MKSCKDCEPGSKRPAPHPGPRCVTHWRAEKKRRSKVAHGRGIQERYGIDEQQYDALYAIQGGRCAICLRATGKVRRLAVDHDHITGNVRVGATSSHGQDMPSATKRSLAGNEYRSE